ncbi:HpcH/HpaI aldolase/citrate lyase family protein [Nitrosophilus labii]|uniref:HpcH/HpaI aldolase/citrate lyase family protein n=1 Tax=Nitrosophilus labii TaxID=2706014 RepID=UPI001656E64F|nr:aldolase/citrate lyase family protein [Nitrosophilus labii]
MIFEKSFIDELESLVEKKDLKAIEKYILKLKREKTKKIVYRSALMVSAHRPKHLNKLDSLEADIAIINLEDGVSKELKPTALRLTALFLSHIKRSDSLLVVRVNPLDNGGKEEIEYLNKFKPDAIRVPKVKTPKDVEKALELIDKEIDLHLSIETKEAFLNLESLRVNERVKVFYLGILDLLSDLDIFQQILEIKNPTIDHILSRFLVVSKASCVLPVSFVYQDYKNLNEFEDWCRYEKNMGYRVKGCISPAQVEIANRVFGLSKEILERAEYIKMRFEEMKNKGITGFTDEKYGFIDEPIYKDAVNILRKSMI